MCRMSAPTQAIGELRGFLHGLPGVDRVGAEARAATLASRSIKTTAKQWALDMAISMIDLTTLEGQDTPGKVRALCAKAKRPDPADPTAPMVAAVCVYPDLAHVAAAELKGSGMHVASVATAFPSGRTSLEVKLADVKYAVSAGADEVDMVIDRGAFLAGDYQLVFDEIAAVKDACGDSAPQGDPGDRRAGHAGQRAAGVLAGHAGRGRLHQDLDRQGHPGRDAAGDPGHAGGRARLPGRATAARSASSRPAASAPPRTPSGTWSWSTRRRGRTGWIPAGSASAPPAS